MYPEVHAGSVVSKIRFALVLVINVVQTAFISHFVFL